jgi:hypothetical protein
MLHGRTGGRHRAILVAVTARFSWPSARGTQWPLTFARYRRLANDLEQ